MVNPMRYHYFAEIMRANKPVAVAMIHGGEKYPWIKGVVQFYETPMI